MHPFITVKKGESIIARIFLDEKNRSLLSGASANCHFTTLTQNQVQTLELFRWERGKLHLCVTADMPLRLQVDEKPLDLPALLKLGIAKKRRDRVTLVLQQNSDTHGVVALGEYQFAFKFLDKPAAPEALHLPRQVYWRATFRGQDWRFLTILGCSLISSMWFGSYLYGLPIPQPEQRLTNEVTFRFARIIVPREALTSPSPLAADGDLAGQAPSTPSQAASGRELLNEKLDSLFSRIDGSLNLPKNTKAGKGRSRTLSEVPANTSASDGANIKVRDLVDYQSQPTVNDKKIAAIDRRPSSNARAAGSLDQGSANLVMRGAAGAIRGCYEDALKADRSMAGKLSMNFSVDAKGKPQALKLEATESLDNSIFLECIRGVVGGLQFPPPTDGPTPVRFSMIFTPSERQR